MSEFDLIDKYFKQPSLLGCEAQSSIRLGIGDDCAVVDLPVDTELVLSIDTLVESIHFPQGAPANLVAERALRVSLSDLAAMGAKPSFFTLAITLPSSDKDWLKSFSQGLFACANSHKIVLAGGDTTKGSLTISIQVHGLCKPGVSLKRSGAKVDELICVSNVLGEAAAALQVFSGTKLKSSDEKHLLESYYRPEPQLSLGTALVGRASACIDISDGLLADLEHILKASDVGAEIELSKVPVSKVVRSCFGEQRALELALMGGDDYQLCFTMPREKLNELKRDLPDFSVSVIGQIIEEKTTLIRDQQLVEPSVLRQKGYSHF